MWEVPIARPNTVIGLLHWLLTSKIILLTSKMNIDSKFLKNDKKTEYFIEFERCCQLLLNKN